MLLPAIVSLFSVTCALRPDKYSLTPTKCIALINNERADINIEGADDRYERAVGRSLDADGRYERAVGRSHGAFINKEGNIGRSYGSDGDRNDADSRSNEEKNLYNKLSLLKFYEIGGSIQ